MTDNEIKEAADMAEKWPGATVLNFGELPFKVLAAWVARNPRQTTEATENFDVESVKGMFEDWWRTATIGGTVGLIECPLCGRLFDQTVCLCGYKHRCGGPEDACGISGCSECGAKSNTENHTEMKTPQPPCGGCAEQCISPEYHSKYPPLDPPAAARRSDALLNILLLATGIPWDWAWCDKTMLGVEGTWQLMPLWHLMPGKSCEFWWWHLEHTRRVFFDSKHAACISLLRAWIAYKKRSTPVVLSESEPDRVVLYLVYLATPYSHTDADICERRFHAVNRVAADLMRRGIHVFSPISHTHPIAQAGDLPKHWEFWMEYDKSMLRRCHKLMVLTLDGWRESIGVQAEIKLARAMGIPVEFIEAREET